MEALPLHDLVDRLGNAVADTARTECSSALKKGIDGMRRSIDSLETQLKDFYDAQVEHEGATLNDYQRMVVSLDEQVKSYIDDRMA